MVSPSSGVVDVPDAYDGSMALSPPGSLPSAGGDYRRTERSYEGGIVSRAWMPCGSSRKRTLTVLAGQHVPYPSVTAFLACLTTRSLALGASASLPMYTPLLK